jgi:hypothetical protein
MFGVVGSVALAFACIAGLGLRSPIKFAPILLVQLAYKVIWLVAVLLPNLLQGAGPFYAWVVALIFLSYVVLDLIAIPFARILAR